MRETTGAGHVAIVTGANHGIGAATARALAARGTAVLCTGLPLRTADGSEPQDTYGSQRAAGLDQVVDAIRAAGGRAVPLEADLAELASAAALFDHAERHLGPVDILVNNASGWVQDTFTPDPLDRFDRVLRPVTAATWAQQFAVDARAPALLIAELARRHRERGAAWGRIIGLTSGGGLGFPGEVSYGAAKAAQTDYTLSAAVELAPLGITANVVHPPVTDTGWVTDEVRRFVEASTAHFHVAEPEDVARTIVHLASDDAALITGNVIVLR